MRALSMRGLLLFVLLFCLVACSREFESPPEPGGITGHIVPGAGESLLSGRVRLLECGLSVMADTESGYFYISDVPSGDYTIRVDALTLQGDERHECVLQPAELALVRGPAVYDAGDLTLSRAGAIRGQVEVSAGTSPLNTVVYLVGGDRIAHAGDSGSFLLEGLPAGTWSVGATRPGFMMEEPVEVEVIAGQEASVTLTLKALPSEPDVQLSGRVLLGNPGPEPGVLVLLREVFTQTAYITETDEGGDYLFSPALEPPTGLPPGLYEMQASHPGYRTVGLPLLELHAGETVELPLVSLPTDGGSASHPWDGDATGRVDDDCDGVPDEQDNCPMIPNAEQDDTNGDGVGDMCEGLADTDVDGWPDTLDNCPAEYNPAQADGNADDLGDACQDRDDDGALDRDDLCPDTPSVDQLDRDGDGLGDVCDPDMDGDGVENELDNCPQTANADQANHDDDPLGDMCDDDADDDGIRNGPGLDPSPDNCPLVPDPFNDANLCIWDLVYAAQDEISGNVNLFHLKMRPGQPQHIQLTDLAGQAFAPSVWNDSVYFHYLSEGESVYRICRVNLDVTEPSTVADCWTAMNHSAMNPAVCGGMMFFEEYLEDGMEGNPLPKWTISMVPVDAGWPPPAASSKTAGVEEAVFGMAIVDEQRSYNFREPACRMSSEGAGWELAFAADSLSDQPPSFPLEYDWSIYVSGAFLESGLFPMSAGVVLESSPCQARRPTSMGEWGWCFDCGNGRGTDLMDGSGSAFFSNAFDNQAPAFSLDADGNGLLVFQSNQAGSMDLFLAQIRGAGEMNEVRGVFRLTTAAGWEGSPAWIP